jgi:hypothetical protein
MTSTAVSSPRSSSVNLPTTPSPKTSQENISLILKIALPILAALAAILLLPPIIAIPLSMVIAFGAVTSLSSKETEPLSQERVTQLAKSAKLKVRDGMELLTIECNDEEEANRLIKYVKTGKLDSTVLCRRTGRITIFALRPVAIEFWYTMQDLIDELTHGPRIKTKAT